MRTPHTAAVRGGVRIGGMGHNVRHTMEENTIAAIATPPGGAIGVVRISGRDAISIADEVFKARGGKPLASAGSHTMHYGDIAGVDEVLAAVFKEGKSYTGEPSVEFYCHGSRYVMAKIMELLISAGASQAMPGEFTKRAYLNRRIDLSQAEAVADLIAADGRAAHDIALRQLKGGVGEELGAIRERLLELTTLVELEMDFSDQDVEFADRGEILSAAREAERRIAALAGTFADGRAFKEGIPVAITGKTNVGKSTLLNALLKEDKAIVSDIHGTTRDFIEDTISVGGVVFRMVDTAGIRDTADEVEKLGIERSRDKVRQASIVLWVVDGQPSEGEVADMAERCAGKKMAVVRNKADLGVPKPITGLPAGTPVVEVSARNGDNIGSVENLLCELSGAENATADKVMITNARHYEALSKAAMAVRRVEEGIGDGLPGDLLAEDLRDAVSHINDIVGKGITTGDVLENIFANFCVGK